MSAINKIETYQLGSRIKELRLEGKSSGLIAEILTKELNGKGSISQTTVSRWIRTSKDPMVSRWIRTRRDPAPRTKAELKRLARDMIRILNAFVRAC